MEIDEIKKCMLNFVDDYKRIYELYSREIISTKEKNKINNHLLNTIINDFFIDVVNEVNEMEDLQK